MAVLYGADAVYLAGNKYGARAYADNFTDNEIIKICPVKTSKNYFASTDGQEFFETDAQITIKKSQYNAKLALLDTSDFYSILRDKFYWGISPANIKMS